MKPGYYITHPTLPHWEFFFNNYEEFEASPLFGVFAEDWRKYKEGEPQSWGDVWLRLAAYPAYGDVDELPMVVPARWECPAASNMAHHAYRSTRGITQEYEKALKSEYSKAWSAKISAQKYSDMGVTPPSDVLDAAAKAARRMAEIEAEFARIGIRF